MSVITGCRLLDGVIVMADTRATLSYGGKRKNLYVDNVQKIIPITSHIVVGFAGNIESASKIFASLFGVLEKKYKNGTRRIDPVSFYNFFPRYLKYYYDKELKNKPSPDIQFIVGSVINDHCNTVERTQVIKLMDRFRLGNLSMGSNSIPGEIVNLLDTPSTAKYIHTLNYPMGLLYSLKSPDFEPVKSKVFEFNVIGSGESSSKAIEHYGDWIFAGNIGNAFLDALALKNAVEEYIIKNDVTSVGGLYPSYKITGNGIEPVGYQFMSPSDGFEIELSFNGQHWIQKNHTTRKEVILELPWNIDYKKYREDNRFDDYRDFRKEKLGKKSI